MGAAAQDAANQTYNAVSGAAQSAKDAVMGTGKEAHQEAKNAADTAGNKVCFVIISSAHSNDAALYSMPSLWTCCLPVDDTSARAHCEWLTVSGSLCECSTLLACFSGSIRSTRYMPIEVVRG